MFTLLFIASTILVLTLFSRLVSLRYNNRSRRELESLKLVWKDYLIEGSSLRVVKTLVTSSSFMFSRVYEEHDKLTRSPLFTDYVRYRYLCKSKTGLWVEVIVTLLSNMHACKVESKVIDEDTAKLMLSGNPELYVSEFGPLKKA